MSMFLVLGESDCRCSLIQFYENVAKGLGIEDYGKVAFDCTKIHVTKGVQDLIWEYCSKIEAMSDLQISMMLLNSGPKADLEASDKYVANVENGFIKGRDLNL